jgi:hypothetical protein
VRVKLNIVVLRKLYDEYGEVKRTVGVWYDDVGMWSKELKEELEG